MQVEPPMNPRMRLLYRVILFLNVTIMTLPFVYLPLTDGSMTIALIYTVGAPLIVVISMFVLGWMDGTKEAEKI